MLGYSEQTRRKPKLDAGSVPVQPEPKGNTRQKKEWNIPFQNMRYKLSMYNNNSNKSMKTSSRWDSVGHHHIISVVAEIIQRGMCIPCTSMKDEHGDTFVPLHLDFYFVLSWYFRPEKWWETVSGFLLPLRSEQSAFLFLIFIPFCKVVRVIILIRLPRRPSSGQPVVRNTRRDIKRTTQSRANGHSHLLSLSSVAECPFGEKKLSTFYSATSKYPYTRRIFILLFHYRMLWRIISLDGAGNRPGSRWVGGWRIGENCCTAPLLRGM